MDQINGTSGNESYTEFLNIFKINFQDIFGQAMTPNSVAEQSANFFLFFENRHIIAESGKVRSGGNPGRA